MPLDEAKRPSNATWVARAVIHPSGEGTIVPPDGTSAHPFEKVEVAWYPNGFVKLTLRGGGPAVIRQAYLAGKGDDVILEIAPRDA